MDRKFWARFNWRQAAWIFLACIGFGLIPEILWHYGLIGDTLLGTVELLRHWSIVSNQWAANYAASWGGLSSIEIGNVWMKDYHKAFGSISLLEIGDGTQLFGAAMCALAYGTLRIRGVVMIMLGELVASLLVPVVGISVAEGLRSLGITERQMHIGSIFVLTFISYMCYKGARGGDETIWAKKVLGWKEWLLRNIGWFGTMAVMFFLIECPDKTGIGTGALQLLGLIPSANSVGSSMGLVEVNWVTAGVIVFLGATFDDKRVAWFGYVGAVLFALAALATTITTFF